MSLLQEIEKYGLADCEQNRKINKETALEKSLFWQRHILKESADSKQRARAQAAIDKLTQQIKALNDTIRD